MKKTLPVDPEGYHKLLEPDIQKKRSQTLIGCRPALICILAILGITAASMFGCHVLKKLNLMGSANGSNLHRRPPIAHHLETSSPHGGVQVASGAKETSWPNPPPHDQVAEVARYLVHISDWASIATFSVASMTEGYPFSNILSLSDGPVEKSTGTPYFYLTPMDLTSHDLEKDSRASLSMSEAQSNYCHKNNFDPESPLCARILLTGSIVKVENGSDEEVFAKNALFSRHSEMEDWPTGHHWYFGKMNITHIYVLDYFGGAAEVSVEDYYTANPF